MIMMVRVAKIFSTLKWSIFDFLNISMIIVGNIAFSPNSFNFSYTDITLQTTINFCFQEWACHLYFKRTQSHLFVQPSPYLFGRKLPLNFRWVVIRNFCDVCLPFETVAVRKKFIPFLSLWCDKFLCLVIQGVSKY